jgi:CO dehydrogenase maturation factor
MSTTIAIAGKGGVGKSTITTMIVRWLNDRGERSVLAVDADANVNLNDLLGIEAGESIGTIREEMRERVGQIPGGMTKQQFLEYKIHRSLVETPDFDLLGMGRPEGPGCYCYANSLLRDILETLSKNYSYVVMDNEAGMEHLSRRTLGRIDYLLIVSDPTVRGVQAAGRIGRLIKELDTRVGRKLLIVNRVRDEISSATVEQIKAEGLDLAACLPEDDLLRSGDENGRATYGISAGSTLYSSLDTFLSNLFPELQRS